MTYSLAIEKIMKPWGVETVPPPFDFSQSGKLGEIIFQSPEEIDSLTVKYIFTSEKLSIQTHPNDVQAKRMKLGEYGKEECWLITSAAPGAVLGIGFDETVDANTIRAAAIDGSIEQMITWHPVKPGDFFYIPANTVHAIGANVGLIEVQQSSDHTFRLYDYGRDRELHLERGIEAANGNPYDRSNYQSVPERGSVDLVTGPAFRMTRLDGRPTPRHLARFAGYVLVIPIDASCRIADEEIRPGQCGFARELSDVTFADEGHCLIAQPVLEAVN